MKFYEGGLEDINAAVDDTKKGGVIKAVLRLAPDPEPTADSAKAE